MKTGDILHVRKFGNPISFLIRLATAPKQTLSLKWASSHTALVVQEGGDLWIYEANKGRGVHKEQYVIWAKHNKDHRLTEMNVTGHRHAIARAARSFYGYEYEDVLQMWKIPFDKKGKTSKQLYCTEFVLRVYDLADCGLGRDPENESPEEFRKYLEGDYAQS